MRQLAYSADFNLRNPNRAQPHLQLLQCQPGGISPRRRGGLSCSGASACLSSAPSSPRVAERLARARSTALEEAGRTLAQRRARNHHRARGHKHDLSNDVREVVSRALAD